MPNTTVTRPPKPKLTDELQPGDRVWWPPLSLHAATIDRAEPCIGDQLNGSRIGCWLVTSTDGDHVHVKFDDAWQIAPRLDADADPLAVLADRLDALDARLGLIEERATDLERAAAAADVRRSFPADTEARVHAAAERAARRAS